MKVVDRIANINGENVKNCPDCGKIKPLTDFARDKSKSDGYTSHCKKCRNDYRRDCALIFRSLLRDGFLISPEKCSMCHKECTPEGHHPDYNRPHLVDWLCRDCHAFVHSRTEDEIIDRIADYL